MYRVELKLKIGYIKAFPEVLGVVFYNALGMGFGEGLKKRRILGIILVS
jgi:hypothetical protein